MEDIIYTLSCPKCNNPLPQALKHKNLLETMEVNCSHGCEGKYSKTIHDESGKMVEKWFFLAKDAIVEEKTMEEGIGPKYQRNSEGEITMEEFQKYYEEDLKSGKVPLDEILKNNK